MKHSILFKYLGPGPVSSRNLLAHYLKLVEELSGTQYCMRSELHGEKLECECDIFSISREVADFIALPPPDTAITSYFDRQSI